MQPPRWAWATRTLKLTLTPTLSPPPPLHLLQPWPTYLTYLHQVGVGNQSFVKAWDAAVRHMVRDIANPTDLDTLYPRSRYKDWYDGHGWANGLFPSPASRNQESISEAVNAWYGISLYGLATKVRVRVRVRVS